MRALLSLFNFARAAALAVIVAATTLVAMPGQAAAQYYPPLTFYNNGLIIKVPQLRLFPGFPDYSGYPGLQVIPSPANCFLDPQMRVFLNGAGFYDISFFGYASTRAHVIAVRGPTVYRLIVHRCTHQILSAVPIGNV